MESTRHPADCRTGVMSKAQTRRNVWALSFRWDGVVTSDPALDRHLDGEGRPVDALLAYPSANINAADPIRWMRVPQRLDIAAVLPDGLKRYADPAAWFVHKVTSGPIYDARTRTKRQGWHPVRWEDMNPLFGRSGVWNKVRGQLIASGVVECDERYTPGVKAMFYRLGPDWLARDTERRPIADSKFARRLSVHEASRIARSEAMQDIYEFLTSSLRELTIDERATRRHTSNPRSLRHRYNRMSVAAIEHGEWRLEPCPYGRLHTNVSSMSRKLRPALRWHGEPVAEVDVAGMQPILVGLMTAEWAEGRTTIETIRTAGRKAPPTTQEQEPGEGRGINTQCHPIQQLLNKPDGCLLPTGARSGLSRDLADYLAVCESGHFYEALASLWGLDLGDDAQRSRLKRSAFRLVLFGPTRPRNTKWLKFRSKWPTVAAFLELAKANPDGVPPRTKADYYGVPARASQRLESELMIAGVCGRLMVEHPETPIWTIHDAVLIPPHAVDVVKRTIEAVFATIGLRPTLKIKVA